MGLDLQRWAQDGAIIKIGGIGVYDQLIEFNHLLGEGIEVGAVCFQVDLSARFQYLLIQPKKLWMGKSFFQFAPPKLWVGEGDPDLFHFAGLKIFSDPIDLGAQESNICELITLCR